MTVLVRRARSTSPAVPGPVGPSPAAAAGRVEGPTTRWWWFVVAIGVYGLLVLTLDPKGQIGSDAAAKVSALEHMQRSGSSVPEVPYWAREQDPTGRFFPVHNSVEIEGRWISVSTLPMIEAMVPLYRVGGVRLALALPIAGALACAWAAAALARRFGADPRAAFFVVALASPVTVYAMTIWEHTLGLAGVAWGAVVLVDVRRGARSWGWAAVAGLAFGAAATMRTEALVYAAVLGATFGFAMSRERRSLIHALRIGGATLAGLQVPLLANALLERVVLGTDMRSGRAAGVASASGAQPLVRLRDGAVGLFAVVANDSALSIGIGVVFSITVAVAVWFWNDGQRRDRSRQLMVVACVITVVMCTTGLGFVPGLLPTAPLAVAGVLALRNARREAWEMALAAVAAILLVWITQYTTNVVPQWSGRYVLASGVLLIVLGLRHTVPLGARRTLIGLSVAVTMFGLVWTGQRTRDVADFFEAIDEQQNDVVISRDTNLLREAGAAVIGRQWLNAESTEDIATTFAIARHAHASTVLLIQRDDQTDITAPSCFVDEGRERRRFLPNAEFTLITFRVIGDCPTP